MRKHPKALPFLFLTEMWERFGFYIVQGMLVLYATKAFHFSDDKSYAIAGAFFALAYISPLIGGILADRLLGFKVAITWGGILLSLGYMQLALPWSHGFYLGLATIIVGNGFFKPNISSLLGILYQPGDPGRDSGFTIFYMGINFGGILAGGSGAIKDHFGWHVSFACACASILFGLLIFAAGLKWGKMKYSSHLAPHNNLFLKKPALIFYCLLAIVFISFLLQSSILSNWLLPSLGIILLFYIYFLTIKQEKIYRNQLILLNVLIISSIIFWALSLQEFASATLFIDRLVNKHIFGIDIPTTAFYGLQSLFLILLAPIFAWLWYALNKNNLNPNPLVKSVLGIILIGLAFIVLSLSTYFGNQNHLINPLWIALSYFLLAAGEMFISPIGLSAVTELAPPRLTGMMMGIWFVAIGFGGQFSGILAKLSSIPDSVSHQVILQLPIYRHAFFNYSMIAFGVAGLLFIFQRILIKALYR